MPDVLTGQTLTSALDTLGDWRVASDGTSIARTFTFKDFSEAFGFMSRVALAAEKADHHPDWSNSYKTVEIALATHSAGGITDKDIALARIIDRLA